MNLRARMAVLVLFVGVLPASGATRVDDRSRELARRDCSSSSGRNELTLFANGTVRLREWVGDATEMHLAELGRAELDGFVRRLEEIDFRESASAPPTGLSGQWVERCDLVLTLDDRPARSYRFGRLDTHDLAIATWIRIVDELAAVAAAREVSESLPGDYQPRQGDILARADGVEFEVVGFTADKIGVELRGRLDPLTIYAAPADLPRLFARVVSRRP